MTEQEFKEQCLDSEAIGHKYYVSLYEFVWERYKEQGPSIVKPTRIVIDELDGEDWVSFYYENITLIAFNLTKYSTGSAYYKWKRNPEFRIAENKPQINFF